MKKLIILGSTGSIGRQTLDIVRAFPLDFEVVGLAAGLNVKLLDQQIQEFQPKYVFCADPNHAFPPDTLFSPMEEMVEFEDADLVMVATTGSVGLIPTLNALKHQKTVALSNKEPIVMAGRVIMEYEKQWGGAVLPVDSEPSAIWQCIQGENNRIQRLIITASGGPFRTTPLEALKSVTPTQALSHPTWNMGRKITIDSATLMNKAFEVMEAHWLFGVPWDNIEVVVHPQSKIHSLVEFEDGSLKAQIGPPDMHLPIQYALFHPDRRPNDKIARFDFGLPSSLTFHPLELERYPCFRLALDAARREGTFATVVSAADEIAVNAFLDQKIGFTDIYRVIEKVVAEHQPLPGRTVAEHLEADRWATARASELVGE
jgi:1-deoxy-D-xylulose-5-phosphate reductoisomerase